MIGHVIGNFRITGVLGAGGMGEVFCAEQTSVGTRVAIKVLNAELSADDSLVQRFFNEARAVSKIRHPGVVQIFDVGRDHAGRAYLIMELLDGETLRHALMRGRMPAQLIGHIGRQLASVIQAVHGAGITHRDLKPDNVFLVPDHGGVRVKVLDFGIAKLGGALRAVSPQTIGTMGTPAYMAPEQWGDPAAVDGRVDLYAMGCLAFEMATARPPFIVTTMGEACKKHTTEPPPRARSLAPDVPETLDVLIDRLLAKDPGRRASISEALATFETLAGATTQATTPPPGHVHVKPTSPIGWIVAALVAFAGIAAVLLVVMSKRSPAAAKPTTGLPSGVALPANSPFIQWLNQENQWFQDGDVMVQYWVVRRGEYERYIQALPAAQQEAAKPLATPGVTAPDQAVVWVTWEQADRYCKAIGGKLLTSERWEKTSAGQQGFNPGGIRVWTSTKTPEGKAIVRGVFAELPVGHPDYESPWSKVWDTEASAGGRDPSERVASREIGIRCTK